MKKFILNLARRLKRRATPPPERSHLALDRLTAWECTMLSNGGCPDCGLRNNFLAGPRGGVAQNFACGGCGSEFNDLGPCGVTRISTPGSPDRERLRTVYRFNLT